MKTVCILTAGLGTRIKRYSTYINKSLLPLKNKAAISHIIEKFPPNTNFVIAVGHLHHQVKDYLNLAYPKKKINFVKIDKYFGKNSGPGLSLYKCKKYLQKPFYFVSCDTIWKSDIIKNDKKNWMGVSSYYLKNSQDYCNIKFKNKIITNLVDKKKVNNYYRQFTGLAHIFDYKNFWAGLGKKNKIINEIQVSTGFDHIVKNNTVYVKKMDWYDIGTELNYKNSLKEFEKYDFSKENEFIYFVDNKVIKFFRSQNKLNDLVYKSKTNKDIYPEIKNYKKQFISYNFIKGSTLYEINNKSITKKLLTFLEEKLWKINKKKKIKKLCKNFYFNKSMKRLKIFYKKYNLKFDKTNMINGTKTQSIEKILKKISWNKIFNGLTSPIHGDLQFDNIIFDKKNHKFKLIDWRENFAGNKIYGDLYYDLAKLRGGIDINYKKIKQNNFYFNEKKNLIKYSIKWNNSELKKTFEQYIKNKNYSFYKINILTGLIFLNMSPLHNYPFDKLLFYHSKYFLNKIINDNDSK